MPNCRTCSPWCNRCHKKAVTKFPVECPVCGRYNPYERDVCPKCGTPIVHDESKVVTHLNTEVKKACFLCSPFEKPLCKDCLKAGRIKVCPECGSYVLGSRATCKKCGYAFGEASDRGLATSEANVG